MQACYTTPRGREVLRETAHRLMEDLRHCRTCASSCGVDRTNPQTAHDGACRTGAEALVSTAYPHFGEENVLSGAGGSGAVFFSRCNMGCVYCQNETISGKNAPGQPLSPRDLAALFLDLQAKGVHNLNWVSPSHVAAQAMAALDEAAAQGLRLPVVYNTGGYDHYSTIRALSGVVDIYLMDIKTMDEKHARTMLKAPGYPDAALMSLEEMGAQVGLDWTFQPGGGTLARGLLVRHLVLPGQVENSIDALKTLLREFGPRLPLHVMGQYVPNRRVAEKSPNLGQPLSPKDFLTVLSAARKMGFERLHGVRSAA